MPRPLSALTTFIRSLPADVSVADVIAQAKAKGFETSESNVSRVRRMAGAKPASKNVAKKAARPKKPAAKKATAPTKPAAPGTAKSAGVSKSEFIRLHPSLTTAEVMAAGKSQGLSFTSSLVYAVRGKKGGKVTPKKTATASKVATARVAAPKKPATMSKSDFIRQYPSLSANEIAAKAKAEGVKLDPARGYKVRGYDKKAKAKKRAAARKAAQPPIALVTAPVTETKPPAASKVALIPTGARSRTPGGARIEDLLKAAAATLGFERALEVIRAEQARLMAVLGA
jgi:histone H1/5